MKVLVVGGGIIGCATAYELAKAGCRVSVFERAISSSRSSSRNSRYACATPETSESSTALRKSSVASR